MKRFYNRQLRCSAIASILLCSHCLFAEAHKSDAWAHSQFAIADHKREYLEARDPEQRTRREYREVIDAYRSVYYSSPTSSKADASVMAVADLMVEMGRRFQDLSILRSAVGQYEFLRREYPGSKYRFQALFTSGQVYGNDLGDKAKAQRTFEEFLKRYPANHFAPGVRAAIVSTGGKMEDAKVDQSQNTSLRDGVIKSAENSDIEESQRTFGDALDQDQPPNPARISGIHYRSTPGSTRVEIDLDHDAAFKSQRIDNPDRIFFDLDAKLASKLIGKNFDVDDDLLKKIRVAQFKPHRARIVLEIGEHSDFNASIQENPPRLIIDLVDGRNARAQRNENIQTSDEAQAGAIGTRASTTPPNSAAPIAIKKRIVEPDYDDAVIAKIETPAPPVSTSKRSNASSRSTNRVVIPKMPSGVDVREAQPTANGDRSLIRALGLKIGKIVIDPGHGGHDTGTIGPNSLLEKDLVLDVSRRLGKLLASRLGAQVVYTRKDDTFIPLETRTAIANQEQADLFVSIHANSSHDHAARGVETYYLNFTSSKDALEVAARENAVSETSIHELQDLVKQIALKEKIEESREFASDVQQELHNGLAAKNPGLRNRGVKKAPFIVLIGANMPSILAEISFVSNPGDERRLETPEYRQRIAESLYRGISKYVGGLSGVKVASRIEKTSAQ